uniref:Tumor necrosis factor receptor superfamily, member 1B n=1 Tax=Astyanax mexicanus TaxID=7994 RepID=A0A3B1JV08_ASTMX
MEFVLQFFFLLCVFSFVSEGKAYTLPYELNGGECRNTSSEYTPTGSKLCCSKCRPGFRLHTPCTASSDTVCAKCKEGTYSDSINYHPNCFSCRTCYRNKNMEYIKTCTTESNSQCECKSGWYCSSHMRGESCTQCKRLETCSPGKGAISPGSPTTKCMDCVEGTFSNETSSRACQPHTQCEAEGKEVLHRGNATHDTVCKTLIPHTTTPTRPPPTTTTTTTTTAQTTPLGDTSPPPRRVVHPTTLPNTTLKGKPTLSDSDIILYSIIGIVAVAILLVVFLTLIVMCHRKGLGKPPVKEVIQTELALDSKMESELLLADGKTSSSSSASSTPDNQSQSTGDSQDNIHSELPSVSSQCVNFSFTATINCQLNQSQGSCSIPIRSPTQPQPQQQPPPYPQPQPQPEPETETHPPPAQPDLPLSQEEQLLRVSCEEENSKDALQSVQESGMTVC